MNSYSFDELEIGHVEQFSVKITKEMEDCFRSITGDINPLHMDDDFAKDIGEGKFLSHVAFGMLTASFYSTLAGVYLPGKYSLIHSVDSKFLNPVYVGDELIITGMVNEKQDTFKLIQIKAKVYNQNGKCVSKADMKVLVLK